MRRRLLLSPLALSVLASPGPALAEPGRGVAPDPLGELPAVGFAALDRPTGIAEAGLGWLTLPGAQICVEPIAGCSEGDSSFELDLWQLFRSSRRLAFGAGILLGLIPTTAAPRANPAGIEREHSRRYLTVEGMIRYYPYVGEKVEWWIGATGGLVVLSDRFKVNDPSDRALLGPNGVSIRTEGGTIGLAGGPVIALSSNWAFGGSLRYAQWFMPSTPAVDALGSEASLKGRNTALSIGFNLAYRMPL